MPAFSPRPCPFWLPFFRSMQKALTRIPFTSEQFNSCRPNKYFKILKVFIHITWKKYSELIVPVPEYQALIPRIWWSKRITNLWNPEPPAYNNYVNIYKWNGSLIDFNQIFNGYVIWLDDWSRHRLLNN